MNNSIETPFPESNKLIISLYDYTTEWVQPYIKAGYPVICWDEKVEGDILENFGSLLMKIEQAIEAGYIPYGILAAPPCTDFAQCGSQWWAKKDAEVRVDDYWNGVDYHVAYVDMVHILTEWIKDHSPEPLNFWVMENPVGRIEKLVPWIKPYRKMVWNPCDYGDAYTKKTILWGEFNTDLPKTPVEPEYITYGNGKRFPKIWAGTGGKSEKTKAKRSATPKGFANAFFQANQ